MALVPHFTRYEISPNTKAIPFLLSFFRWYKTMSLLCDQAYKTSFPITAI